MLDEGTFITLLRAVDKSNSVNSDRMFFATERTGPGEGAGRVVGVGDLDVGDLDGVHSYLLYLLFDTLIIISKSLKIFNLIHSLNL